MTIQLKYYTPKPVPRTIVLLDEAEFDGIVAMYEAISTAVTLDTGVWTFTGTDGAYTGAIWTANTGDEVSCSYFPSDSYWVNQISQYQEVSSPNLTYVLDAT
jgi:hypothetical protein